MNLFKNQWSNLKLPDGEAFFFAPAKDVRVAESGEADEIFAKAPEVPDYVWNFMVAFWTIGIS